MPKTLSVASTSSVESLHSLETEVDRAAAILRSNRVSGAFTSYIRRRGEPDGRTASLDSASVVKVGHIFFMCFF